MKGTGFLTRDGGNDCLDDSPFLLHDPSQEIFTEYGVAWRFFSLLLAYLGIYPRSGFT